ncbi:MAG: hypothetical protein A2150_05655 [Candidatus Muproteobacteria bacterium RBG_16_64_11]|uniref:CheW-like domain-containing protein n=1 Tax=Candidatus Muproteobacteria bacterium RBG_16_64_11 TaxID=1817758 RepID=A0A1F6TAE6_9PROT|nr:MAG: hypothetical protein A2150_05655 [Candidatus Muproteobacteria bacterium RBG_16_64_11]
MADPTQYLRIEIDGAQYLLPSAASLAIEQRDHLVVNDTDDTPAAAWRVTKSARWPAYCLDRSFKPVKHGRWQRAVFLDASPHPIGLMTGEAQLMARTELRVEPFSPPGPAPSRFGHLFNGAWVEGSRAVLVLDPAALIGFLQGLGGRQ